jgi:hypothetical protein
MKQLISEIELFCTARDISPQKFLRDVINARWGQWQDWKDGKASPTLATADRIRDYIAKNQQDDAA